MRWRLGKKRRLVIAVTCVPIPPFFFALPLRQMWLPLIGPFPVNSQILAINVVKRAQTIMVARALSRVMFDFPIFSERSCGLSGAHTDALDGLEQLAFGLDAWGDDDLGLLKL